MAATSPPAVGRGQLLRRLGEARRVSDELFAIVKPDAIYDRPIAERNRIIFYVGHLEAFDWNLIGRQALELPAFDSASDRLYAFGIDPVDGQLPVDRASDWPTRARVSDYVRCVRTALDDALLRSSFNDLSCPLLHDGLALQVAIEHRLMHAETLAYMLHRLPIGKKHAPSVATVFRSGPVQNEMLAIPEGEATLGMRRDAGTFGWDNEFEEHRVLVPAFRISRYKLTNGDFLQFVREGGYGDPALWAYRDWVWKNSTGVAHPQFWVRRGAEWHLRTMFAEIPLPADWPVFVSHAEASAFARWSGRSLPSEAQFHRAAYGSATGLERAFPWGGDAPAPRHGNFGFVHWDPAPVNDHPAGASALGVEGLLGNGWEWTSTPFGPFEGFVPFSFYPGYSADFFDGKHYVMKGGSMRTSASMLRRSFRNWFQGHYPFAYAGFRLVEPL